MNSKQRALNDVRIFTGVACDQDMDVLERMTTKQLRVVLSVAKLARKVAMMDYGLDDPRAGKV